MCIVPGAIVREDLAVIRPIILRHWLCCLYNSMCSDMRCDTHCFCTGRQQAKYDMSYDDEGVSRNFRDGMNQGGDQGGDGLGQDTYGGTDPLGQVVPATYLTPSYITPVY